MECDRRQVHWPHLHPAARRMSDQRDRDDRERERERKKNIDAGRKINRREILHAVLPDTHLDGKIR